MKPPIKNMVLRRAPDGDVTQWFGENPQLYARFGMLYHNGIDLVRPHGEPMFAMEDATVAEVKDDPSGFGRHLRIISDKADKNGEHNEWTYGHCHKIHVKQNDKVKAGQLIAYMGNTGFTVSNSTGNGFWNINPYAGTHLHLGLRKIKWNKKGWRYRGSKLERMDVMNYDNGTRGAIDPKVILSGISDTHIAEEDIKMQIAELKERVTLLQQLQSLKDRLLSLMSKL